jgi:hypothetical protein
MNEIQKDAIDNVEKIIGGHVPSRTEDDGSLRLQSTITKDYMTEQNAQEVLNYTMYKNV